MNERRSSVMFETEPQVRAINVERSMGRNAIEAGVEKEPLDDRAIAQGIFEAEAHANGKESIRRPDGLTYAQDQDVYKAYAGEAADIIMQAFVGDFSALDRISDVKIREALRERILAGNNEIDKMISVACIGLAPHLN